MPTSQPAEQRVPRYLPHFLPPFGARGDHVTGGKAAVTRVGRVARRRAGRFRDEPAGQIHGGSSRPEGSDSRDRDLGETVDALCRAAEQLGLFELARAYKPYIEPRSLL